jgi:hypothetical protein
MLLEEYDAFSWQSHEVLCYDIKHEAKGVETRRDEALELDKVFFHEGLADSSAQMLRRD